MTRLLLDAEQHFTCQMSGRCCRRPWEVVVSPSEVEGYRRAGAERWFRERSAAEEGTQLDPFEPVPGFTRLLHIRKRDDGACGFFSPEGLCRLHEELGARRKPLTCRTFPWRFHPTPEGVVVTARFSCPTVLAGQGKTPGEQRSELKALRSEWAAGQPEPERSVRLHGKRSLPAAALATLREVLREMLDRPGPSGRPDLRRNVGRMARSLEDLSRWRVLRLSDARLSEYLELTGRFAARSEKPLAPRPPGRLARLFFRGLVFVVGASRVTLENRVSTGLRLGLRLRLFRLLGHVHGLGPPVSGIDMKGMRRTPVPLDEPGLHRLIHSYLRAAVATLGTGRRPVVAELGVAVGLLNAACATAAMRASSEGRPVAADELAESLMEASDNADDAGRMGRILELLAGGVESLYLFETGAGAPAL